MIKIDSTEQFDRRLAKICSKKPKVAIILVNALRLITKTELSSASLKIHKLTGELKDRYTFSLSYDLRVIFRKNTNHILLVNIGSQDEVY